MTAPERSPAVARAMSVVDRSSEPAAVFEAREPVNIAADVAEDETVERVARAIYAAETASARFMAGPDCSDTYRRLARAALAAMPPADEALRERKLARLRQLAEQWATLTHWDYKGSPKIAEARAKVTNDAARIVLNVLDGGDLL